MKSKLAIAALTIGMLLGSIRAETKPKQEPKAAVPVTPALTFDQQFFAQVDRVNVALEVYGDISCTNVGFKDAEASAIKEYNKLVELYRAIPDSETQTVKAKQVETMIGVNQIAVSLIQMQGECINQQDEKKNPEPSSSTTDKSNRKS